MINIGKNANHLSAHESGQIAFINKTGDKNHLMTIREQI
jgi:hypothetical protein